ncbi:TerB family tellurite resistance protein [Polaribacter vadi]|uniref:TerB family tellurite resistance protein n=1 Tax=Polaribacter vadi TaxID=1774273 RepID=UPI0030EDA7F0|tara:strand:- start:2392 stop:2826 length:435 start_codon:yes stop_codon:yes gene_type:complete
MAFLDLYSIGKHKQEIGHFANIVKIAKADGTISDGERALLAKAGERLNITLEEFTIIFNNPEKFPTNSPISYDERIERLFRLSKMVLASGEVKLIEINLLQKIAIRLNFKSDNTEKICKKAIDLVLNNSDLDNFITEIKKLDQE